MSAQPLNFANTADLQQARDKLATTPWLVACLCAQWCNTCEAYRAAFNQLSTQHPDKCFAWLDIEDQAHLVDEVDVENFPTILIQHEDDILFFGTVLPDAKQLNRLIASLTDENGQPATRTSATSKQATPKDWSLRRLMTESV